MRKFFRILKTIAISGIILFMGILIGKYLFIPKYEPLPKVDYADFLPEKVESNTYHPPVIFITKKSQLPKHTPTPPIPRKKVKSIIEIKPKKNVENEKLEFPKIVLFQDEFGRWFIDSKLIGKVQVKHTKIEKRAGWEFRLYTGVGGIRSDFSTISFSKNIIIGYSFWYIGRLHTGLTFWLDDKLYFAPSVFFDIKKFKKFSIDFAMSYIVRDRSVMFSVGVIR